MAVTVPGAVDWNFTPISTALGSFSEATAGTSVGLKRLEAEEGEGAGVEEVLGVGEGVGEGGTGVGGGVGEVLGVGEGVGVGGTGVKVGEILGVGEGVGVGGTGVGVGAAVVTKET
jgi:hypothetical protein